MLIILLDQILKLKFFDKEARVTNPGGIYKATLEDILDKGIQTYRNPGLINI